MVLFESTISPDYRERDQVIKITIQKVEIYYRYQYFDAHVTVVHAFLLEIEFGKNKKSRNHSRNYLRGYRRYSYRI